MRWGGGQEFSENGLWGHDKFSRAIPTTAKRRMGRQENNPVTASGFLPKLLLPEPCALNVSVSADLKAEHQGRTVVLGLL